MKGEGKRREGSERGRKGGRGEMAEDVLAIDLSPHTLHFVGSSTISEQKFSFQEGTYVHACVTVSCFTNEVREPKQTTSK